VSTGLLLLAVVAFLTTCDDDPTGPRRIHGVASVTIVPASQAVPPGDTVRLVAEVRDTSGRTMPDEAVTWSSSAPSVARVDAAGLVTGVAEGEATITATAARRRGTSAVTVSEVVINPDAVIIDSTRVRLISEDTVTGQYVFQVINGPAPELDTMSIIVGAQGEGFLRHVDGVRRQGNLVYVETSQAGLGDVVETGILELASSVEGSAERIGSTYWGASRVEYLHPGVRHSPGQLRLDGLSLTLEPKFTDAWGASGKFEIDTGEVYFKPSITTKGKWSFWRGLTGFSTQAGGTLVLDISQYTLDLKVTYSGSKDVKCRQWHPPMVAPNPKCAWLEKQAKLLVAKRPFVGFIGPMPVVGAVIYGLNAEASYRIAGGVTWTGDFGASLPVTAGMGLAGGVLGPISGSSASIDHSGISFRSVDGSATGKFGIKPEVFLEFYKVGGPYINLEGYLKLEAGVEFPSNRPALVGPDWDAAGGLGVDFNIGARVGVLRKLLKRWDRTNGKGIPLEANWKLWGASLYPLVELFSVGDVKTTVVLAGPANSQDAPATVPVRLRPAFVVRNAPWGKSHAASTQDTSVSPGSSYSFADVRSGPDYLHKVSIPEESLQGNCSVTSQNPHTVEVWPGTIQSVTDTIACIPLGDLKLRTTTNGSDIPARFLVSHRRADTVGADARRDTVSIPAAADTVLEDFVPANPANGATGEYRLSLDPGARNCATARPDTQQVFIQSGDTVTTHFTVHCVALGQLTVTAPTTDPEATAGGPAPYSVSVTPADPRIVMSGTTPVPANGTATFAGLVPLYSASGATGGYTVTLTLPGNRCSVAGGQRQVTVFPGDTALADFPVTCVERLFVRTTTTGPGRDADGFDVQLDGVRLGQIGSGATQGFTGASPGSRVVRLADVDPACFVSQGDAATVTVGAWDSTLVAFSINCPAPGPPTLVATVMSTSEISLGWTILAPPKAVAFYRIFRGSVLVDSTTAQSWQDTGLPPFTRFTYGVRAVTSAGVEGPMGTATARTRDATPPGPPASLRATALGSSAIGLAWGAASDPESGIARYRISRDGSLVDSTGATSWQDTGLAGNTTYRYDVVAVNGDGLAGPPASDT
ncbi:MAG: Ig-like domain-containing protein, partial [Gemmatimonadota bacterium]|nr:Ig-like domain-containing protein [Gemmatimonadota bacterium]